MSDTGKTVIKKLAETYPQLYLDPDRDDVETYQRIVRRGIQPKKKSLEHFYQDPRDRMEILDTPAGPVDIVLLNNRQDFEVFLRNMMAAKDGPSVKIPKTQGAATLVAFNWPRIHAHKQAFLVSEALKGNRNPDWNAEFKRFTADKSNYQDFLVVLSAGPYSAVSAETVGLSEEEWLEKSYTIRKYHECTHFVCRKLYSEKIEAVWDELLADAIGIYAAFGRFDPKLEKRFLGFQGDRYTGGRLENYTDELRPDRINHILALFEQHFKEHIGSEPFEMIAILEGMRV